MKTNLKDIAYWGGKKQFENSLPVGQVNLPSWEDFEKMIDGIFERAYYSNHGILAQEFEDKLCSMLAVKHCITMTNETIALMLSLRALNLDETAKILVPAYTFASTVQAITWAGYEPVFCDVDRVTHIVSKENILKHINNVQAILAVHLWGNVCPIEELDKISSAYNIPIIYDASHAFGNVYKGLHVGHFGKAEVFSFHATNILSCTEGGAIATNDDDFAEILRNLRSSYGRRKEVPVNINCNGRFSEFQAGMGLLALNELYDNCELNKIKVQKYKDLLIDVQGIKIYSSNVDFSNEQYLVLEINENLFGLSRDTLCSILQAENIIAQKCFTAGMYRCIPYKEDFTYCIDALPNADVLSQIVMQLPLGSKISLDDIEKICDLIKFIHKNSKQIMAKI